MTIVDEIHAHLDRNIDDHMARLVLADALEEQDSDLAEGYRTLGKFGIYPQYDTIGYTVWIRSRIAAYSEIEYDWWYLYVDNKFIHNFWFDTRREVEDKVAKVFKGLSMETKNRLKEGIMHKGYPNEREVVSCVFIV
jgi:hypothetical protein